MANIYCNRCGYGYEGGCQKHHAQTLPTISVVGEEKPSLLERIKRIFKR